MRRNLGYALRIAHRVDLARMTPHEDLASTRFCLAEPGEAYLVYLPDGGTVDVNLAGGGDRAYLVEWFSPKRDSTAAGEPVAGGGVRTLESPFSGDVVLLIWRSA
jgi:hypothetical protein